LDGLGDHDTGREDVDAVVLGVPVRLGARVESRRYRLSPSSRPSAASPSRRIHSTSRAKAGSKYAMPGSATPMPGVITDWWAPPSGERLTPDGVATTMNFPPA